MEDFILDAPLAEPITAAQIREFDEAVALIDSLTMQDELVLEAVNDIKSDMGSLNRRAKAQTAATTKTAGNVYRAAVAAQTTNYIIKFNIISAIAAAITKIAQFSVNVVNWGVDTIAKTGDLIIRFPKEVVAKINGDLQIYLTAADIIALYNETVIQRIDTSIAYLNDLTKSETWTRYFLLRGVKNKMAPDDMKKLDRLHKLASENQHVKYERTIVKMNEEKNIDIYLSNKPMIKFKDLHGNKFEGSYCKALYNLLNDIKVRSKALTEMQTSFGNKYKTSQANSEFTKLSPADQKRVQQGMEDISHIMKSLGELMKYAFRDIKTISAAVKQIDDYYNKTKK